MSGWDLFVLSINVLSCHFNGLVNNSIKCSSRFDLFTTTILNLKKKQVLIDNNIFEIKHYLQAPYTNLYLFFNMGTVS